MINDTHFDTQVKSFKVPTREEERALALKVAAGDKAARELLINSNLRFVFKQAHKHYRYYNACISFEGLVQEGTAGLCQAIDRFDVDKGYRLVTYAVWWIKNEMNKYILSNVAQVKYGKTQAERKLFFKIGEIKTMMEIVDPDARQSAREHIAKKHNVKIKAVADFERRLGDIELSFDAPLFGPGSDNDSTFTLGETLSSDDPIEVEESDLRMKVLEAFNQVDLDDREFIIICERVLNDEPTALRIIGKEFGICRERVRQIQVSALKKIRLHFEAEGYDLESLGLVA